MIFRQLVEPLSNTYTYVLGCEATGLAILIDPVIATMDRDLRELQVLGRSSHTLLIRISTRTILPLR